MGHKAVQPVRPFHTSIRIAYFVILSNIDLGSNMKVGKVTLLRSAPGRNWDIMWESTA